MIIGYDSNEEVAYHVLVSSIIRRTSEPVSLTPINLNSLKLIFNRKRSILQSTEFSFSRFLVPYLSDYQGWSIFMDCDMLMLDDIAKLWELRNDKYALMCVHHNHVPDKNLKFLNQTQTKYERKNWSSVMLMNNTKCTALTLQYVETASGLDLHRFRWLKYELIGEIPHRWNHLVDYDPNLPITEISNLHYTEGGPYFEDYKNCGYSNEWLHEFSKLSKPFNNWYK